MGDETDAMWDAGMIEQGREDMERTMLINSPTKTRCPTCGKLFKCVEAHHVVKHRSFIPVGGVKRG